MRGLSDGGIYKDVEERQMNRCDNCKNAEWDFETFHGTTKKEWFVSGCLVDGDPEQEDTCERFERRFEKDERL